MSGEFGSFPLDPSVASSSSVLTGVTMEDLQYLIDENSSFRGYLQGYLAEMMLRRKLLSLEGVTAVDKIPDRDPEKGDLKIQYRSRPITMEVKSLATRSIREDVLNETWQGTVLVKNTDRRILDIDGGGTITSTNIRKGEFDILAICCFAVRGSWDFMFIESQYLPEPDMLPGLVQTKFSINPMLTPGLTHNPIKALEAVYHRKQQCLC